MTKSNATRLGAMFAGLMLTAFLVIALWSIIWHVSALIDAERAKMWTSVQGTVISSTTLRGCGKGGNYYPHVEYKYTANGRMQMSNRIAFGSAGCGLGAEDIAKRYPINSTVIVHFNPKQPTEAVLMAGSVLGDTWLGLLLSAIFFMGCAYYAVKSLRAITAQAQLPTTRDMSDSGKRKTVK